MTDRVCSVDGCHRTRVYRRYCEPHYRRWRRHGDPLATRPRGMRVLTDHELVQLRRAVGLPDTGPTPDMRIRWLRQEANT